MSTWVQSRFQRFQWLDFLVFSDKDDKTVGPVSQFFTVHNTAGRKRIHALFEKSRARSSRCCGLTLLCRYQWQKTWSAWLDVSKKACGVWGHAHKISHKSKRRCRVPEHVDVDVERLATKLCLDTTLLTMASQRFAESPFAAVFRNVTQRAPERKVRGKWLFNASLLSFINSVLRYVW